MANFCKVFQVAPDEQVLVQIGYDPEEEHHYMSLSTDFPELHLSIKFSAGSEEHIRQNFEQYDFIQALDWRHRMEESMKQFHNETEDQT